MKEINNSTEAFFALLRAGLWEQDVRLLPFGEIDLAKIHQLAEEQSLVGIVAAGIEHVVDVKFAKDAILRFIGHTIQLEQRNKAMNAFIGMTVEKMRRSGIHTVLVKGQGVAQCYERPLWRVCGDVDLFFDAENYERAKEFLMPLASSVEPEEMHKKHFAMIIDSWVVELHGLMPTEISERINAGVERVQEDIFDNDGVRVWCNNNVEVFLPNPGNDAIIIFTHFLQHFFVGGVGLRQISDWCRLLWTYRADIDHGILEQRLREMGIVSEWKAFAAFAVEFLGMSPEAIPLFERGRIWSRRAGRICQIVLEAGNFGHNKDNSYRSKYPRMIEKIITLFRRFGEYVRLFAIFPLDSPRFFVTYVFRRTREVL